ncbi:TPA: DEAD/DEAH box helicase family protein [Vibrio parahaemolyticus]|nr:DEAD/DEAH box helicase family protein [Vibrio parahaemolyticus]HCG7751106.1 DEAD/DEAH box helicase family protein [Vibrio parahaemolyticus]
MLQDFQWELTYSTSDLKDDGTVVNILQDFYVPALQHSIKYDRVAGYFSSSSLAIASQGFSQFVNQGGKARFVVGADLDEDDAKAILDGDQQRLTESLVKALGVENSWPEQTRRGIELLAWMVANGHLEVRVGVRKHKENGTPLPFDSTIDGYVHEKWALFSDGEQSLYVSGSLNESKTALQINAENLELRRPWTNEENKAMVEKKAKSFELIWNGHHPAIKTYALPEAIRNDLVRLSKRLRHLVEVDGSNKVEIQTDKPANIELLRWHIIKDAPLMRNGLFVGMETAPVEPWPHQRVVARRVLERWPANHMLCDEVGLGKTIEAGLIFRSLKLSKVAESIMIAAPASLTKQWMTEMAEKFYLPFKRLLSGSKQHEQVNLVTGTIERLKGIGAYEPELLVASTGLFYRSGNQALPEKDLILVDEAHKARRKNPSQPERPAEFGHFYKNIRDKFYPQSKSLLLATATPMQINPVEVSDLIRMMPHAGALYRTPGLIDAYYDVLNKIRDKTERKSLKEYELDFIRNNLKTIEQTDPLLWKHLTENVADAAAKGQIHNWLMNEKYRLPPAMLDRVLPVLFAAAPLSRVMLRHTRSLLEEYRKRGELNANLAQRHVSLKSIEMSKGKERLIYDELEKYCTELAEVIAELQKNQSEDKKQKSRFAVGFYLTLLRLRFSSCLHSLRLTLERRLDKVTDTIDTLYQAAEKQGSFASDGPIDWDMLEFEDDALELALKNRTVEDLEWEQKRLEDLLQLFPEDDYLPKKTEKLLEIVESRKDGNRIKQMVVFTRFADTMRHLVDAMRIRMPSLLIGTFSGEGGQYFDPNENRMVGVDRNEIKQRFLRGKIDILLCTDAAAEGLNLQTSDLLVNFDLPWNPMLVEQRIGRIDRIGQTYKEIFVYNLCYQGSVEESVYGRLLQRLEDANLIVGTQQISLIPVTEEEFRQLADKEITEEQLQKIAEERAQKAIEYARRTEQDSQRMYAVYQKEKQRYESETIPVRLNDIWDAIVNSAFLKSRGAKLESFANGEAVEINGISGIPGRTLFTVSRELFEEGIDGDDRPLVFATYGEPLFDLLVSVFTEIELPQGIVKLESSDDMRPTMVAYAVNQSSEIKLVHAYKDIPNAIENLSAISELEESALEQSLQEPIYDMHLKTAYSEKQMIEAGKHTTIVLGVTASSMLAKAADYKKLEFHKDAFEQAVKDYSSYSSMRDAALWKSRVEVEEPKATYLANSNQATIFTSEKGLNGKQSFYYDPLLMHPALTLADQEARGVKGKMSELKVRQVLKRLDSWVMEQAKVSK